MPGIIDGHMHPVEAGGTLLKCNLNYASLTVTEMQQGIAACIEQTKAAEPDDWLEVVSWFQENMRPAGEPTGLLEDAAQDVLEALLPKPTAAQHVEAAAKALDAMRRQGVTRPRTLHVPSSSRSAL